jgi:hypothetical protein
MEVYGKVIEIALNTQVPKNGGGTYPGALLTYRNAEGKMQEKGFHANVMKHNPAVANGLADLQTNDNFVMVLEKEGEFWNVKSLAKAGETPASTTNHSQPVAGKAVTNTGSTYATAEERAQTQKYIVRQSSITAALKMLEINDSKKNTAEGVINLASEFEAWVFAKEVESLIKSPQKRTASQKIGKEFPTENDNPFADMDDDIPL